MSENPLDPTECTTLVDILRWRALHRPDRRAYTFLVDGETEEKHLTYGELDCKARAIGAFLQDLGASGERILLLYPPGLEYIAAFFGCLYAGAIAVPSYPPRLNRPDPRIQAIVADAQASVVLTTTQFSSSMERRCAHTPSLEGLHWIATDSLAGSLTSDWREPAVDGNTLAFLQYTSGSTATPKGVMVSHSNLMHNLAVIQQGFGTTPDSLGMFWLPFYHDMGLIGGVLETLYCGAGCVFMSPLDFLQSPVRWLQAISRARATISGGPNFAYDLCTRKVSSEQRETLDLSSWKIAFNGAEPVRYETLQRFAAEFESCGFCQAAFYPCYGLAEATLMVSGGSRASLPVVRTVCKDALLENRVVVNSTDEEETQTLVSCGRTLLDQKVVTIDPESLTLCPPGQVGEIWVSGESVAQGYWNRPKETGHTFWAQLTESELFLRTGDLGFLQDGELFIAGRLKDLIIIRGRNYYPQDIELTVAQSHPALQPDSGAAFSVDLDGEERLVIVQELQRAHRNAGVSEVVKAIRKAVGEQHGLEVYAIVLLKPMSIPKTTSGKIQRYACRSSFLAGTLNAVGEWTRDLEAAEPSIVEVGQASLLEQPQSVEAVRTWLTSRIARRLGVKSQHIDIRSSFASQGLGSMETVSLLGELEDWLGRRLSPTLAWEYPTVETLSQYLAGEIGPAKLVIEYDGEERARQEPIAIVGIGCRFPKAKGADEFWRLLREGIDAITEVPAERWDARVFYDPDPESPGKAVTRWGGFLEQVDQFDPYFFGISPLEAARLDPQQRLLLEVAWEALEDAGQAVDQLAGTRTGVFIGISTNDYGRIQFSDPVLIDAYAGTSNALSIAANRLSYQFDFRGPSVAVDTACSSSLVAVHLACCSLWNGEATLALAGGVNLVLSPAVSIGFSKAGVMSPDGRCKVFDAQANGYVRGEGAAVVVLKPLSRALADGDSIYALVRGSAVDHDGRSNGLMAPSPRAQEAVLREAYRRAGVSPAHVQYVEAHGTGTFLGDPIEAKALGIVVSADRPSESPCMIGSVKSNIGHLEAAAGIAGLIKVALSLKQRAIPPTLHFQEPNPLIPFDELRLRVQQTLGPWPDETRPLLAGVSSFGFGGTNAHLVLEEAPRLSGIHSHDEDPFSRACFLPLSAHSPAALKSVARIYQDFLSLDGPDAVSVRDICYTAGARRSHHDYRLAVVGHSREELSESLAAFLRSERRLNLFSGRRVAGRQRKLVFVFPGQGSQWIGMGRELLEQEAVFRGVLEQCDHLIQQQANWSLLTQIAADETHSRSDEIDVIQPALFAIQVGLAALWRSWGVEPDAVVGHSMGEVAAAYVAGALDLEDAVRVICLRSQLLKRISGRGAMALVGLSIGQVQKTLAGYEDRVAVAVSNSPTSTVLSGDPLALEAIVDQLQSRDVFCRWVKVDVAAHGPQTKPLSEELMRLLEGLQPRAAATPVYSTVVESIEDSLQFNAGYWGQNLRQPVLFSAAVQQALQDGYDTFLEISPHPILLSAIQQGIHHSGQDGTVLPSLRRQEEERAVMLGTLGALYALGYPLDWSRLYPSGGRCVSLPSYPWQRERFWLEEDEASDGRGWKQPGMRHEIRTSGHPLLGQHFQWSIQPGTHCWEIELSVGLFPYLADHCIQGAIVLPAAVYSEMALAAAREVFGTGSCVVEAASFKRALVLPRNGTQRAQLVISPALPGAVTFQFSSFQPGDAQRQETWTLHAAGTIRLDRVGLSVSSVEHPSSAEVQARRWKEVSSADHYRSLRERGLEYGPSFQGVERIWRKDGEAVGWLSFPEMVRSEFNYYRIHPVLLDACLQVLAAAWLTDEALGAARSTYLPVSLDCLRVYGHPRPDGELRSHALFRRDGEANADVLAGDVFLLDESDQVMMEALGLRLQRLETDMRCDTGEDVDSWLYEIRWQPKPRSWEERPSRWPDQAGCWLIFSDKSGVGEALGSLLEARGESCVMVLPGEAYKVLEPGHYQINPAHPDDFERVFKEAWGSGSSPCCGVVHLWSLEDRFSEEAAPASLDVAKDLCASVLHLVQALTRIGWQNSPRLWLVTRGVHSLGEDDRSLSVAQSPLWGLGRTIAHEHPDLDCTLVDLGSGDLSGEAGSLFEELVSGEGENQVALRGEARHVARLMRYSPETSREAVLGKDQSFRLEVIKSGVLESLSLRAAARQRPGCGEVEIQVCAAGLNFLDVLSALGLRPDLPEGPIPLGVECAGKIVALGDGVDEWQVGDEVVAIAPFSFGRFAKTLACLSVPKPPHLSFEEAATIPIAFLTAYYALYHLGRLAKGERVLIHSAAGGVGLAAVQVARWIGAEVLATAGTPEKREFLKSIGVQHVADSRSLAFAEEVLRATDGEGVDVVLNALAGEFISKGLSILRSGGRFLEIGKRDIYQNSSLDLGPFRNNLSFLAIDLNQLARERPVFVGSLLREIVALVGDGALSPLPFKTFPISEVTDAFSCMAKTRHIGKLIVLLEDQTALAVLATEAPVSFRADGAYLITGGLGGLGLTVAQWMVERGARNLALMGRSEPSAAAQRVLQTMREAGTRVLVVRADVTQRQQVDDALAEIDRTMPPLRGLIHAAGVLADGTLLQLDRERFGRVMGPKVEGAWNLHNATLGRSLDWFVLFSSAASLLGSPGQGNYAAANAFLDALAHHRRLQGLPALSINWGPWSKVGLAAQPERGGRLALQGIGSIDPEQGLEVLDKLLRQDAVQVGVIPVDWAQLRQVYPAFCEIPLLVRLAHEKTGTSTERQGGEVRETLLAEDPEERQRLLETYLKEQLGKMLGAAPSKLDVQRSINELGLDSLIAVRLKAQVEHDLGIVIPIVSFFQGASVNQLAVQMLGQLAEEVAAPAALPVSAEGTEQLLTKLDELSDGEVDSLLGDLLYEKEWTG
ncbi:MAG: SDR family NAD(P)-dependent oxidoreductase [Anaerolineae bacterium]|nr:SDR family NAD(P)-dependent oxidoreductase [Anaerolineae bacterium]